MVSMHMTIPGYYHTHCGQYHARTFHIDPAPFLSAFVEMLPPGAHVLDIGCGSGRDLLWLTKRGFRATGFDASPGLASLARQHSGCTVIEGDFEIYDFSNLRADALLLSGALVHLPHDRMKPVLQSVLRAVAGRHSALVYLSLKEGEAAYTDKQNRVFHPWRDPDARAVFHEIGLEMTHFSRTSSRLGTGEVWLGYVLVRKSGSPIKEAE